MRIVVSCQLKQENQRDFVRTLSAAEEADVGVITDSRSYRSVGFVDQSDIYHITPFWPDSTAAIRELHPLIRRQYRVALDELEPDILLSLGASRLLFLGVATGFEPTVHLPQGGELSKAVGNIYWDDSWFKKLRYRYLFRTVYRRLLDHVSEVWTSGTEQNRTTFTELGLPADRYRSFDWDVVDTDEFAPHSDPVSFADDETTVIGSFRRIRGTLLEPAYRDFLDAVGRLAALRDDFHIVIGGFYPDDQSRHMQSVIDDKIDEHDLDSVVTCLDLVPKAELPRYLSGLDVYLNFTHRNLALTGIGSAAKEGMACGCALVTYDEPDVSYVVDDGNNGVIVPYDNVDTIVDRLETLCEDDEYRKQLSQQGRNTVVTNFSPSAIRNSVLQYCHEIVERHHG